MDLLFKVLPHSVYGVRMTTDQLNSEREALFAELLAAFGRRDHEFFRAAMQADVAL